MGLIWAEALAGFPDQQLKMTEEAFDALSGCVQQQVEQGGRAGFWTALKVPMLGSVSGCSSASISFPAPFPLALLQHQSHLLSSPHRFCPWSFGSHSAQQSAELTWAFKETWRALESDVAQWFCCRTDALQRQCNNVFTLSVRNRVEIKKFVNEAQKCYRIVTLATALTWSSLLWIGRS